MTDKTPAEQIDAIIAMHSDWRGELLARLRLLVLQVSPSLTEEVKWKKPSKPEGVPVWSRDGIVCIGEALKHAVRLTFPKGAYLEDPHKLFNARLDSNSVRAIDFHEGDEIDEAGVKALVLATAKLNTAKKK